MDDKVYTSKVYELKTIGNLTKDKPYEERAEILVTELSKIELPETFQHAGYDIQITKQPHRTAKGDNPLLTVHLTACKDGKPVNVDDGVFEYLHPPIMVHDGTYYKESVLVPVWSEEEGLTNKLGLVDKRNLVEDPVMALKEIIVETLRVINKEVI